MSRPGPASRTVRAMKARLLGVAVGCALLAAACGPNPPTQAELTRVDIPAPVPVTEGPAQADPARAEPVTEVETASEAATLSPLARSITPVGSSTYDPADHAPSISPVSLSVDGIRVDEAPIRAVGVRDDGELEVPPASEVGWYRFGPSPGEPGSAVLAAHIAFDGEDGVFRDLAEIEVGAIVEVGYVDDILVRFEVIGMSQYDKAELPFDAIFASEGEPILTLITCGGEFNPSLSSYEDNVVAYAVAITD